MTGALIGWPAFLTIFGAGFVLWLLLAWWDEFEDDLVRLYYRLRYWRSWNENDGDQTVRPSFWITVPRSPLNHPFRQNERVTVGAFRYRILEVSGDQLLVELDEGEG